MRLTVEHPNGMVAIDASYPSDNFSVPTPTNGIVEWRFETDTMRNFSPGVTYIVNWRLTISGATDHLLRGELPIFDGGPV